MIIGNRDTSRRVLVVAEIGNNHEGRFEVAQELVRRAAECGVDAVKTQTFRTEHYVSCQDAARFARLKSFELSEAQIGALSELAHSLGLLFLSTPFDLASAAVLEPLVDAYKIASGDINFYPLLARVADSGKPLIISTGASDLEQVARTVEFVRARWRERGVAGDLAVLHCVSSYPVPPAQANLRSIPFLADRLGVTVGYSDHVIGCEAAVLAVGLGARIVEKHFTLDKGFSDFRDHQISADPAEMRDLVARIGEASAMLGEFAKEVQPAERAAVAEIRRSIVAGGDLPVGLRLREADITWIRPAGGLPPGDEDRLVGRVLRRAVHFGEPLSPADVE